MSASVTRPRPAQPALLARRLLLGQAVAASVIAIAIAVLLSVYSRTAAGLLTEVGDYGAYHSAASAIRSGGTIYERALYWSEAGWADSYPAREADTPPYPYPPAFAMAFLPFPFVPVHVGVLIWLALLVGCIVGTATVLTSLLLRVRWLYRLAAILGLSAIIALFQPVRASLRAAQVDCLLLLLLALALWAFIKRSDFRAGAFLALAVSLKPFLGFLVFPVEGCLSRSCGDGRGFDCATAAARYDSGSAGHLRAARGLGALLGSPVRG